MERGRSWLMSLTSRYRKDYAAPAGARTLHLPFPTSYDVGSIMTRRWRLAAHCHYGLYSHADDQPNLSGISRPYSSSSTMIFFTPLTVVTVVPEGAADATFVPDSIDEETLWM